MKEERGRREEALEEEKEALESCCSALRGDLEQAQRQERRHGEERDSADAKVKVTQKEMPCGGGNWGPTHVYIYTHTHTHTHTHRQRKGSVSSTHLEPPYFSLLNI